MSTKHTASLILATPDLKRQLQEMAMVDFDKFLSIIALDEVQIFVCADRQKGKSLQQIVNRLKMHGIEVGRTTVAKRCKKCTPTVDSKEGDQN